MYLIVKDLNEIHSFRNHIYKRFEILQMKLLR
jgi:hypothetical protein